MSGAVAIVGFKSRKVSSRGVSPCWKCRDGRTRAHHRLCSKRGGKTARLCAAWEAEVLAAASGKPSPGRLRGSMQSYAQLRGQGWRHCQTETEKVTRELSPLTASPDGLNRLAALYGVDRHAAAEVS